MESLDEITKNNSSKKGFFKHVFNFDDDSKEEMLNIIQYSIISLLPVIILNKAMQRYVPEADEEKGNVEILAEIIIQVVVMFIGLLIIHRIITFIPTYSGSKYADFSVTNIILAVLLIVLSLQTKLGEKVSILADRVMELWEGKQEVKGKNNKTKGKGNVKVIQPISQNQMAMNQSLNSQSTSLSQLPPPQMVSSQSPSPDYNNMYQQDSSPLVGAASPPASMYEGFVPMAANEALGGSGFGGANW